MLAAIRPGGQAGGALGAPEGPDRRRARSPRPRRCARSRRRPAPAAARRKLGDVRYVYTWDGERIFKVVSFFLLRYAGGRLGEIAPEYAHEVAEVRWLPLDDAPRLLAYTGEREMAEKALAALAASNV